MSKYFVFSDAHSYYNELMTALSEKGFDINNKDHKILSLGDCFDRGPDSVKMLDFIMDLHNQDRAILIKGNHEDLIVDAIHRGYLQGHDYHNGTNRTMCQLTGLNQDINTEEEVISGMLRQEKFWDYIDSCIDYFETDKFVFVHGWIPIDYEKKPGSSKLSPTYYPTYKPDWRNSDGDGWKGARWLNGMEMWWRGITVQDKTIYCGHWSSSWGHANLHNDGVEYLDEVYTSYIDPDTGKVEPHINRDPFTDVGIVAMDATTCISHKVNVIVLEI